MGVTLRQMSVCVAVHSVGHRVMTVVVMAVVMSMRVFMLQVLMLMLVSMGFRQMDDNAQHHQQSSTQDAPTD